MDSLKVTDYYNNGYNGGITVEVTVNGLTKTFEVDGADIVVGNRPVGCALCQMTAPDEEFIYYEDDDGRQEYIQMGWIEEGKDDWDCDIMTEAGLAAMRAQHMEMLNDMLGECDESDIVIAYIKDLVSKDEDYLKPQLKETVPSGKDWTWTLHFAETLGCDCEREGEKPYVRIEHCDNWRDQVIIAAITEAKCIDKSDGIWELTLEGFEDGEPYKRMWVLNQEMAVVEPY